MLASAIAVIGPEEPSLARELIRQPNLEALELLLGEKSPLLPALTGTCDDQRFARQSLDPDAFRTSYEQP
jgi:hypothetical protein